MKARVSAGKIILVIFICAFLINISDAYPSVFPTAVTKYDPNLAYNGYTLVPNVVTQEYVLIDMNGNIINSWSSQLSVPILHEPGHVLCAIRNDTTALDIIEFDWEGNIINSWLNLSHPHHDMEELSNGHLMVLTKDIVSVPEISKYRLLDDSFLELDAEGNIVWEWHARDHFDEYNFSDTQRQIIYDGGYYEIGIEGISWHACHGIHGITELFFDWAHHNTLSVLPVTPLQADSRFQPGNILTSMRTANNIYVIDKETGNITWQYGMKEGIIGQHCAEMLDNGNILLFDNGGLAGYPERYRWYSRVIEINPISKRIVWEFDGSYTTGDYLSFFSFFISGAQRLPNGNTLICEGRTGRVFEVTSNKTIVWEFVNPHWQHKHCQLYRVYRVPYDWAPPGTPHSEIPVIPPPNEDFRIPPSYGYNSSGHPERIHGYENYVQPLSSFINPFFFDFKDSTLRLSPILSLFHPPLKEFRE